MKIRPYVEADAPVIADLLRESVSSLAGAFYTPEQVKAWVKRLPDADRVRQTRADGRMTFIAETDVGVIQAFTDMEVDGHIDYLYATPKAAGTGAASVLYDYLEREAVKLGLERLYTEASEHACRFFDKKGFTNLARRDFEIGGMQIHNFAMEKRLF